MSDNLQVGAVSTYAATEKGSKNQFKRLQDAQYDNELARRLTGDKKAQKARQNELQGNYSNFSRIVGIYDFNNDGIIDKEERKQISAKYAKKAAENQVKNELAYEKVRNTVVYYDKEDYERNKKADKEAGRNPQYIKDKNVRNYIENNRQLFFDENGNFSQDMYKDEVVNWTGADWKLNLDERRALAYEGESDHLSKGSAKKMAEYGGFEIQKDYTNLKRAGVIAGSLALAVGSAYLFPKITNVDAESIVNVLHENGVTDFNVSELHDKIKRKTVNPTAALAAALPPAILAASLIKEKSDKDIFTETEAARIVLEPNGTKRVLNENGNREIVQAIKDLPNLNDDQKIMAIMYGYGASTGKKVNERELIAAYEAAKAADDYIAQHGQIDAHPQQEPSTEPVHPIESQPTPSPETAPEPDTTPQPVPTPEPQPQPQPEPATVIVQNGESIARLAKKYGVSEKEIIELNKDQLKRFKSATNCSDDKKYLGFLVGAKIKLPAGANEEAVEANKKTTSEIENNKYKKASKNLDGKLCPERTKTFKPLDENFRKRNNIRTTEELAEEEYQKEQAAKKTEPLSDEELREKCPGIAKPAEDTPKYEAPKWEVPNPFVPTETKVDPEQKTKVQKENPSIQELSDEAKKRRDAQKPWYQFW